MEKIVGEPTQVTISRRGKHWYVSIGEEFTVDTIPVHPHPTAVGIDMGVVNSLKKNLARLAVAQRALSRKVKFSENWRKQQATVAGIHIKVANCRDLQVSNMTASAAGTVEAPGTNVAAEAGLNRSILEQGWETSKGR